MNQFQDTTRNFDADVEEDKETTRNLDADYNPGQFMDETPKMPQRAEYMWPDFKPSRIMAASPVYTQRLSSRGEND